VAKFEGITDAGVSDLIEKLAGGSRNGTCEFVLANDCPSSWGVVIVAGGVRFFNSDGTDFTDGPKQINLTSGNSYSFHSADPEKCVKQNFLAMTVYVPGEGAQNMTWQGPFAGEGECWIRDGVILGPANSIRKDQLGARGRHVTLQLRRAP
jgi:hypothetical protein